LLYGIIPTVRISKFLLNDSQPVTIELKHEVVQMKRFFVFFMIFLALAIPALASSLPFAMNATVSASGDKWRYDFSIFPTTEWEANANLPTPVINSLAWIIVGAAYAPGEPCGFECNYFTRSMGPQYFFGEFHDYVTPVMPLPAPFTEFAYTLGSDNGPTLSSNFAVLDLWTPTGMGDSLDFALIANRLIPQGDMRWSALVYENFGDLQAGSFETLSITRENAFRYNMPSGSSETPEPQTWVLFGIGFSLLVFRKLN